MNWTYFNKKKINNFECYSPESMRTRQDAFYLVPEVSCSPDSPVWYSTQSVPRPLLARMLHRVLLIQDVIHNLRA